MSFETESTFLGKSLNLCSKEELIQCIEYLNKIKIEFSNPRTTRALILGKLEMLKRGE
jgi:hypothetical protein